MEGSGTMVKLKSSKPTPPTSVKRSRAAEGALNETDPSKYRLGSTWLATRLSLESKASMITACGNSPPSASKPNAMLKELTEAGVEVPGTTKRTSRTLVQTGRHKNPLKPWARAIESDVALSIDEAARTGNRPRVPLEVESHEPFGGSKMIPPMMWAPTGS